MELKKEMKMARLDQIFIGIVLGLFAQVPYGVSQIENAMNGGDVGISAFDQEETQGEADDFVQAASQGRDPFWPVGYVPEPEVLVEDPSEAEIDETGGHVDFSGLTKAEQQVIKSKMVVGGILQQGDVCLAIINNQLLKQGDGLSLKSDSKVYEFTVIRLTTEKILLESMQ